MTTITLPFSGYPLGDSQFSYRINGTAEIKLTGFRLVRDDDKGTWYIPNGKILPWTFVRIEIDAIADVHDVQRFVRGRYWSVIDTMLIAKLMKDQGYPDRAKAFDQLADAGLRRIAG